MSAFDCGPLLERRRSHATIGATKVGQRSLEQQLRRKRLPWASSERGEGDRSMPHSLYGEKQQTAPAAVCATPFNSSASTPPPARMASLLAHQQRLTADLQRADSRGGSVP